MPQRQFLYVPTFDVEYFLGARELTHDVPLVAGMLSSYPRFKATFNVAALALRDHTPLFRQLLEAGHEIALHGYRHDLDWGMKSAAEQDALIGKAKRLAESRLGVPVRGWATPRGNFHSARVPLLRRHGFLYVRDRAVTDYHSFVLPRTEGGIVDLNRFGHDEMAFIANPLLHPLMRWGLQDRPRHLPAGLIRTYYENLIRYKRDIERSYCVTNMHPFTIGRQRSVRDAFAGFLEFIAKERIGTTTAADFCGRLLAGRLALPERAPAWRSTADPKHLVVWPSGLPRVSTLQNLGEEGYFGRLSVPLPLLTRAALSLARGGPLALKRDYDQAYRPFRREGSSLSLDLDLPPYSTAMLYLARRPPPRKPRSPVSDSA